MFGNKFFNEIKGSQPLEKEIVKEAKKEKEINVNIEDLDKPIVFEVKKSK